jgi:hypothetical protein
LAKEPYSGVFYFFELIVYNIISRVINDYDNRYQV